ncbi:DNA-3-methyladenine glycosylase I [Catelliglobosispora koreensis]|uniref:DNA-3-methyladenine glycosylase I n=1 Tax=Catelliglobosispora koreensis TaxID=129052 RepID=UPI000366C00E|nr:DNA-3-methyladenine glycosylase I [Catelliglobosispora koreensis]
MAGVTIGADGLARCSWAVGELYEAYHDQEWGQPVRGDDKLFERMSLEAFQSGLSWITILRKRPAFRKAFANFKIRKVAAFGEPDVERLLADAGIVRNRSKIEATIANARVALEVDLDELLWSYAPARGKRKADIPATTPESIAMSKALKKKGFRFVGPTTCYALMQATGMVDDHIEGCHIS